MAKHTVADPTTAVNVAVIDLEGVQGWAEGRKGGGRDNRRREKIKE